MLTRMFNLLLMLFLYIYILCTYERTTESRFYSVMVGEHAICVLVEVFSTLYFVYRLGLPVLFPYTSISLT